jgi:sugar/nucleoside kinase (ribokinase family)
MKLKQTGQLSNTGEKPHFDILVPGDYFCDVIFTGLPTFPALGTEIYTSGLHIVPGGTLNTIIGLRRLSVNVGWISAVGNDFFSHYVMHLIETEHIDTSLVLQKEESLQRVTVSLSYPEDRAFISHVEPAPDMVDMVIDALEKVNCTHFHFPGLTIDERIPDLIAACHARNITVSMDCQHQEYTLDHPLVGKILSAIDLFMPNCCESRRLTDAETSDDALIILGKIVPYVVMKSGARGAFAFRDGKIYHEPPISLPSIVDTTGAGDVFNAGFLAAYLQKLDTTTCLQWGNYCGGMSTQGPGGTGTAPTRAQVEAWMERNPVGK